MGKWKCSKCKREFAKRNQQHSCVKYPVALHFKNKEGMKPLYVELKKRIGKKTGPFRVESLPCCIHFVSQITFAGVFIMRSKIRVTFAVGHLIKKGRIKGWSKMSANRFLHAVEITDEKGIDAELLSWLGEARNFK